MTYSYDGILSNKKEWTIDVCNKYQNNYAELKQKKGVPTVKLHKDVFWQVKIIYSYEKQISDCLGLGVWGRRIRVIKGHETWRAFGGLHNCTHMLKFIESYPLNMCNLLYAKCILIKLLKYFCRKLNSFIHYRRRKRRHPHLFHVSR